MDINRDPNHMDNLFDIAIQEVAIQQGLIDQENANEDLPDLNGIIEMMNANHYDNNPPQDVLFENEDEGVEIQARGYANDEGYQSQNDNQLVNFFHGNFEGVETQSHRAVIDVEANDALNEQLEVLEAVNVINEDNVQGMNF